MNSLFTSGNIRHRGAFLIGAVVAAGCALLYFFNPAEHMFFPVCMFHRVTGLNCPGCGGLRATHQLLHGHLAMAFQLNPLFVVSIPAGIICLLWSVLKKSPEKFFSFRPVWLWIGLAAAVAFGVARNLPFAPFAWMTHMLR